MGNSPDCESPLSLRLSPSWADSSSSTTLRVARRPTPWVREARLAINISASFRRCSVLLTIAVRSNPYLRSLRGIQCRSLPLIPLFGTNMADDKNISPDALFRRAWRSSVFQRDTVVRDFFPEHSDAQNMNKFAEAVVSRRLGQAEMSLEDVSVLLERSDNEQHKMPRPIRALFEALQVELRADLKPESLDEISSKRPQDYQDLLVSVPETILFIATQSALIHYCMQNQHYRLALMMLLETRKSVCRSLSELTKQSDSFILGTQLCARIDVSIGHVFLRVGCPASAEHSFELARKWVLIARSASEAANARGLPHSPVDMSLGYLCRNLLDFLLGTPGSDSDQQVPTPRRTAVETAQGEVPNTFKKHAVRASLSTVVDATNNLALTALFHCQMDRAVALLEAAVTIDPATYLTDAVVFNLCTLYDLCSDSATAEARKKALQRLSEESRLVDLNQSSFRVGQ